MVSKFFLKLKRPITIRKEKFSQSQLKIKNTELGISFGPVQNGLKYVVLKTNLLSQESNENIRIDFFFLQN